MHMSMSIIMGKYLGLGKYNKENGLPYKSQYMTAFVVPVLIHTIYDGLTVYNPAITAGSFDEERMAVWVLMGLVVIVLSFIFQIVIIRRMKRDAQMLSEMLVTR